MDKVSNSDAQKSTNGQRMDSKMPVNLSIWAEKGVFLGSINQRMVNEWSTIGIHSLTQIYQRMVANPLRDAHPFVDID
jgi:porphobilinogen deaminase